MSSKCERTSKGYKLDLTNRTFGRLTVLKFYNNKAGRSYWWCRCECGVEKSVYSVGLQRGSSKSCGCLRVEKSKLTNKSHGEAQSAEYNALSNAKARCYNKKYKWYHRYGGRGIQVCQEWLNSYEQFLKDMGKKPTKRHQLDRINNNGDYEPSNCRWVEPNENARNASHSKWWYIDGIRFDSAQDAANALNVVASTIRSWCMGKGNKPPKANCYSEQKYTQAIKNLIEGK